MYTHFNYQQLHRYVTAFGTLFNNIKITRATTDEVQRIVVPLDYGPKEKWIYRLTQDPDFLKGTSITLPRLSYEINSVQYDASRKLHTLQMLRFPTDTMRTASDMYMGVPYNIGFELSVLAKYNQDGFQIIEQILPYFTPDLTIGIRGVAGDTQVEHVVINLNSVTHSDNYEGDFEKRRVILWELHFVLRGYFYGPKRAKSRIQEVLVDIYQTHDGLIAPPVFLLDEQGNFLVDEDATGYVMGEATPDVYIHQGRHARVSATSINVDADVADDTNSTTTITEYENDIKREHTVFLDDESV